MGAKAKKDAIEDMQRRLEETITRDEWNKSNKKVE